MKNWFHEPKNLFTLLMIASVISIVAGTYLGVALGMQVQASVSALSAAGILLWAEAWGEFLALCLRLRKGESAFTASTGKSLRIIGWCMVGLAAVTAISGGISVVKLLYADEASRQLIQTAYSSYLLHSAYPAMLQGALVVFIFLGVAVVAKILRGLLEHAMALEAEQEGVV